MLPRCVCWCTQVLQAVPGVCWCCPGVCGVCTGECWQCPSVCGVCTGVCGVCVQVCGVCAQVCVGSVQVCVGVPRCVLALSSCHRLYQVCVGTAQLSQAVPGVCWHCPGVTGCTGAHPRAAHLNPHIPGCLWVTLCQAWPEEPHGLCRKRTILYWHSRTKTSLHTPCFGR